MRNEADLSTRHNLDEQSHRSGQGCVRRARNLTRDQRARSRVLDIHMYVTTLNVN